MRFGTHSLVATAVLSVAFAAYSAGAAAQAALAGKVSSAEEGAMEGVLVSAKKAGSTITITVVSDKEGRYGFPAAKLEPGRYAIRIRAVGYDLEALSAVEVAAGKTAALDLKLKKTVDLAAQLSNGEWMASVPGTDPQKGQLLNCVGCHSLERVVRSQHDADAFTKTVLPRMQGYVNQSIPQHPQLRKAERLMEEGDDRQVRPQDDQIHHLEAAARAEHRRRAGQYGEPAAFARRRQGMDAEQRLRRRAPPGCRYRQDRNLGAVQERAQGRAAQHLRRHSRLEEQRLVHRLPLAAYRAHRREERRGKDVRDTSHGQGRRAAPRHDGRAGPAVVRAVPRRQDRDARHEDRTVPRLGGGPALVVTLRRHDRQERRGGDGLDDHRPSDAARHQDGKIGRVPASAPDQHPARLRGQLDHAGDFLGRQQPRRVDRETRAARLGSCSRTGHPYLAPEHRR